MKAQVTFSELANIFAAVAKAEATNVKRDDLETRYDEMLEKDFDEVDLDAKIDLFAELRKARKDTKKALEKCFGVMEFSNDYPTDNFIMDRAKHTWEYNFVLGSLKRAAVELASKAIAD